MSNQFSHYKSKGPDSSTVKKMTLYNVVGEPVLHVKIASEANKPYFNEFLRRNQRLARLIRGRAVDVSMMEKTRESDRLLYAKFILVGWEGVVDKSGTQVEFSIESAQAFLEALPSEEFDEIRAFCTNTYNFTEVDTSDEDDTLGNL